MRMLKGNGCRNRHVEETVLFQEIADVLNVDVGAVNAGTAPYVERIVVENIGVKVSQKDQKESA